MMKSLAASMLFAVALAAPAFAADSVPCTKAEVKAINEMIHASTDEAMMKKAMHNVEMARKMAKAGDIAGCSADLMKAMKEVAPK